MRHPSIWGGCLAGSKLTKITSNSVTFEKDGGSAFLSGFDNIVLALGVTSHNPLESRLKPFVSDLHVIGDASSVSKILNATTKATEPALTS